VVFGTIRCAVVRTVERLAYHAGNPNPWAGGDPDLRRTCAAVDATTPSVSYFRNLHGTRQCILARYRHADAEGAEYRGERP
jgi:hypothetical protein